MSATQIEQILEVLKMPVSEGVIAERCQLSPAAVRGLIRQLNARGLISKALPGAGACKSGCGSCSMKNFCASSEENPEPPPEPTVWRLTHRGLQATQERRCS